jgi:WD40 repeat protein
VLRDGRIKWPAMRFSIPTRDRVYDISIHPDGKRVAAAMRGGTAMVMSVTGDTLFYLSGKCPHYRIWSQREKDCNRCASSLFTFRTTQKISAGCDDRRLRIYEAENGSLLSGPFVLHSDWIRCVAWSPDGQRSVSLIRLCVVSQVSITES